MEPVEQAAVRQARRRSGHDEAEGLVSGETARIGVCVFSAELAEYSPADRRHLLEGAADAGLDHLHIGDHVTFHGGYGWDGLINATALLNLQDALPVQIGIYQLPLRHPTVVARQLSTIHESHPGRLIFGVGVGGDDPNEMAACGVDPRTRGKRMTEGLQILRELLAGHRVTFSGKIFQLDGVAIEPAAPDLPILIGGRSDAALRRTGRFGDGWVGIWTSPERFAAATARVAEAAEQAGREGTAWQHNMTIWCGLGDDRKRATRALSNAMQSVYQLSPEIFERWSPAGTPEDIAEFVAPYLEAGASTVSLIARGQDFAQTIESVGEVRRLLSTATDSEQARI
jgi:alkanesulfonate monooxygenase SsuD/methylene tetrahydromethanopterin reductase-like flavin-dependent oxidoreductase (luciferase family)